MVGIPFHEQLCGATDRGHSKTGLTWKLGRFLEHQRTFLQSAGGEGQNNLFLVSEVLIDRAFGVLQSLGDAVHIQTQIPARAKDLSRSIENQLFTVLNFALFGSQRCHTPIFLTNGQKSKAEFRILSKILWLSKLIVSQSSIDAQGCWRVGQAMPDSPAINGCRDDGQ